MHTSAKPLLQRRNSSFSTLQATLDGLWVIGLICIFSVLSFGYLPIPYFLFCLLLMATMGIVYDRLGVYRFHGDFTQKTLLLGKAWSISFAILLALGFLSKTSAVFSRQFLILFFVCGAAGQILIHIVSRYIHGQIRSVQERSHALVIGTGELSDYISQRINQNPWLSEKVIGIIDNNKEINHLKVTETCQEGVNLPVLGGLNNIMQLVEQHDIRNIYIAVPLDDSPVIENIYFSLLDKNINVHWAPNIFAMSLVNHSVKELAGIPIITLSETPLVGTNLIIKALEDKVLSLIALLLISPVLLLAALAVKLDSPGPIFFKQARTGWDGKNFEIWKFRSMRIHEPESGFVQQATRDDPRITRVGKFLRRTSIDELPQLFNVLNGSMSLVGPRPHAISHNEEYAKRIKAYLTRHRIKPGITGLAQVRGFRGETTELSQMSRRVESDLEYINNWSIWLDLVILMRTVLTLFHKNAY